MSQNIISYKQLKTIQAGENHERMVALNNYYPEGIICRYEKPDMLPLLGEVILIRETLAKKLKNAVNNLKKIDKQYALRVVYAYRHPNIQKKYFLKQKKELSLKNDLSEEDLINLTHNFVAPTDVAGHTCGAAIDLTITKNGTRLDMGTNIADFTDPEKIKTFSSKINKQQKKNRLILREVLLKEGFAPFDGEWWHFSYGDKEWAYYYKKQKSIYSPILLT